MKAKTAEYCVELLFKELKKEKKKADKLLLQEGYRCTIGYNL